MQKRLLSFTLVSLFFLAFINWSCSKLDVTDIGSDLIPAVDNVKTFDTVLTINTTQGIFNDTTIITRSADHALGRINFDPLFGTTTANIFMQLKPTFYPFYVGNAKDTINNSLVPGTGFDSIVLCINYKGFWGDSTIPQQLVVKEIKNGGNGIWDSTYQDRNINFQPTNIGATLGTANVDVRTLGNWVKYRNGKDSARYQIRINLSNNSSFLNNFYSKHLDTAIGGVFYNDSLFRVFQNGFAVYATSGSGLMYCSLTDTTTKLEVHFRRKNGGVIDTTYTSLKLSNNFLSITIPPSATCNNIIRNRTGFPVSSPTSNEVYLQTSPGSYVNIDIPGLPGLDNRIVHRAELIMEQVPPVAQTDKDFSPPNFLYLDLKDTGTTTKWKPVYYDLNPSVVYDPDFKLTPTFYPGSVDFNYFGGFVREKTDPLTAQRIKYYNINLTRYVQEIVTKRTNSYQLRLFAPYNIFYPQYSSLGIGYYNFIGFGRVKLGSGSNPNYKMRLRIVYSKI